MICTVLTIIMSFHRNMGAYSYALPRIMTATRDINGNEKRARYVGRPVSAAPATGINRVHHVQYEEIMNGVFGDPQKDVFSD
jgi:2-oxoglutarate dehydrogenase E1 component